MQWIALHSNILKDRPNVCYHMEKDEHIPARTQFLSDGKNDSDDVQKEYEHTRLLLYEILKERGVNLDSETGKKIDDKSDIETLLRVIQNEKRRRNNERS